MAQDSDLHIFTLSNGMRCVYRQTDRVGYCGVVVGAGSRDDGDCFGLAHFVEHTIFKGTLRRRSRHISSRMEGVGGDLNAYTSKDHTVICTAYPAGYSPRALDLLADLTAQSTFPADELDKEREVVTEEINLYLDNPAESIFDDFEDRIYAGSGAGHNILGTADSVARLSSGDCLGFRSRYYVPCNMTLYCTDSLPPRRAEAAMERFFGSIAAGERNMRRESATMPGMERFHEVVLREEGHQAHTIMGCRTAGRDDPDRFALYMLNNYLGGPSMNSLLNRELRDKRGYVYTVDSSVSLMDCCGAFMVYFGCDARDTSRCMKLVNRAIGSLASSPMKPALFERVRRQYLGQLVVSGDNRESGAIAMGKSLLDFGRVIGYDYVREQVMDLTPESLRRVAERLASPGLSVLTLAPASGR